MESYIVGIRAWRNEAQILVISKPASLLRLGGLIDPAWIRALVPLSAGNDTGHVAVGSDSWDCSESRQGQNWCGEGVHLQMSQA